MTRLRTLLSRPARAILIGVATLAFFSRRFGAPERQAWGSKPVALRCGALAWRATGRALPHLCPRTGSWGGVRPSARAAKFSLYSRTVRAKALRKSRRSSNSPSGPPGRR